jgi:hypothetical protein
MTAYDDRRLWPGTVPPAAGAPVRAAGSVRRTTSVDLVRPDGLVGPLVITGQGRDLATPEAPAGAAPGAVVEPVVVGEARTELVVAYTTDRTVTSVEVTPPVAGIGSLLGVRAGSGFRRALAERLPDLVAGGSLVHLLLDETPPATLISGSAMARQGALRLAVDPTTPPRSPLGICAGWQAGGAMFDAIAETGLPLLGWGPPAPDLTPADDPWAWHELGELPPASMRRRRLLDVAPGPHGTVAVVVRFRDSYWEPDGTETVVHEYRVAGVVDPDGWVVRELAATPGPLPAPECPSAAASVERLVGRSLVGVREVVRDEFVGTTTCTHLNDVVRSLADVPVLWASRRPVDAGA